MDDLILPGQEPQQQPSVSNQSGQLANQNQTEANDSTVDNSTNTIQQPINVPETINKSDLIAPPSNSPSMPAESNPNLNTDADLKQILEESSGNSSLGNEPKLSTPETINQPPNVSPSLEVQSVIDQQPPIPDVPVETSQDSNVSSVNPSQEGSSKWLKVVYILAALVVVWIVLYLLGISVSL